MRCRLCGVRDGLHAMWCDGERAELPTVMWVPAELLVPVQQEASA